MILNQNSARKAKGSGNTATNKRFCGAFSRSWGYPMLEALETARKFYCVSYGASENGLRHRPRPVSCRPFSVTAGRGHLTLIMPAGTSALRKTSQNLDVRCNVFWREAVARASTRKTKRIEEIKRQFIQ